MRKKSHHQPGGPSTGNDFIELAKRRGAKVSVGKGGFTSIETTQGKVHINPSNENLDKWTRSNLRRWFKLLGLMKWVGAFLVAKFIGEAFGLF